jgi:prophage regulatory protein
MRIIRLRDVIKITGLSRSTIYLLLQRGGFPQQIKLSVRAVGWKEDDIYQWINSR